MKAETADYLAKARTTLADARKIAALPLPHVAARAAEIAQFKTLKNVFRIFKGLRFRKI